LFFYKALFITFEGDRVQYFSFGRSVVEEMKTISDQKVTRRKVVVVKRKIVPENNIVTIIIITVFVTTQTQPTSLS
jgi:hypothetical protein